MINFITYHNKLFIRSLHCFDAIINSIPCALLHIAMAVMAWRTELYILSYLMAMLLQWAAKYHRQYLYSLDAQHIFATHGTSGAMIARFAIVDIFDINTAAIIPHLLLIAAFRPQCIAAVLCATIANSILISYVSLSVKRMGTARWVNALWTVAAMIITKMATRIYPHAQPIEQHIVENCALYTAIAITLLFSSLLLYIHFSKALPHKKPFYTAASIERNRYRRIK